MTIFDKVEKFASYGFNKSHAAAYAYVSYVTAYLKANYPSEWLAALMTSDRDDLSKVTLPGNGHPTTQEHFRRASRQICIFRNCQQPFLCSLLVFADDDTGIREIHVRRHFEIRRSWL